MVVGPRVDAVGRTLFVMFQQNHHREVPSVLVDLEGILFAFNGMGPQGENDLWFIVEIIVVIDFVVPFGG